MKLARWLMTSHPGYFNDVTVTMMTLAVEHGQTKNPGYLMTSWTRTLLSGLLTDVTMIMVTLAA